jgi:hypothetical protein
VRGMSAFVRAMPYAGRSRGGRDNASRHDIAVADRSYAGAFRGDSRQNG